jgi:AbrB family looped-hinge helix DNA binding protein
LEMFTGNGIPIGVLKRIDGQGRIHLSKEIKELLSLDEGDRVVVFVNAEGDIIIRPIKKRCFFCSSEASHVFNGVTFCADCLGKIKQGNIKDVRFLGKEGLN